MASTNMKAVITLTADAQGVQVGVNRALAQMNRLTSAVQGLRNVAFANVLLNAISRVADGVMDEMKRIGELGRTYSAEGSNAANQLAIAQMESDSRIGEAFGGITAAIDQATVQHIKDLTDYIVANKDAIGQAMAAVAGFGMGLAEITATSIVAFGKFVDWLSNASVGQMARDVMANPASAAATGTFGIGLTAPIIQGIYELLRRKTGD